MNWKIKLIIGGVVAFFALALISNIVVPQSYIDQQKNEAKAKAEKIAAKKKAKADAIESKCEGLKPWAKNVATLRVKGVSRSYVDRYIDTKMHDINYRRAHTIVHWVYLEPLQIVAQYPDRFASDFMDMGKLDVHLNG